MKFSALKLLADENVSKKTISFLRSFNIDIVTVEERGWLSEPDSKLLEYATNEERFIFTYDSDFGELIFKHKQKSHGIIYIRLRKTSNVIELLQHLIKLEIDIQVGTIVVIEDDKVRTKQAIQLL